MTPLTTILGLVPLRLFDGEFWGSMVLVVMGGFGVATPLSLFRVPALYALVFECEVASQSNEAASACPT